MKILNLFIMTRVMRCNCQHEFQDEVYGPGMRLFNEKVSGNKVNGYKCTVCGKEIR